MKVGTEWLVEAAGCREDALRDESALRGVFEHVIGDLGLKTIDSIWHTFPGEGGVTGLVALTESHLACHTYPEHGTATFNLYCCRTRPEWDWETNLSTALGSKSVTVTKIERGDGLPDISNSRSEISNLKYEISDQREISDKDAEVKHLRSQNAGGER